MITTTTNGLSVKETTAARLKKWQEANILTTINKGDLVLIPLKDPITGMMENVWFDVTSSVNRRWVTGRLRTEPNLLTMVHKGEILTFRRTTIIESVLF